ncbi:hypothetical protein [Asticcacaulis sp. 201]|uniref:hypothetical protein n=1 Tax=Asticcacaulis sp. 201 TaxID=3028787 RepID=UPI002915F60E|nr:hypothetical protein [Asticcacaulis sp. 201]MDV6331324.1 hypothetical protein [Asticcacaulis sp. 201]
MRAFKISSRIVLAMTIVLNVVALSANATPTDTPAGNITMLAGGWTTPDLRIALDIPFQNPAGCSLTDGYIVPSTLAGNQLLSSLAITAYSMHKQVKLTIDGCYLNRPQVISVIVDP